MAQYMLSTFEVEGEVPGAPQTPEEMKAFMGRVVALEDRVVAAHDWDVWGVMHAGCAAAYVARSDVPFVVGQPPDVVGADLSAVADAILDVDEPRR
jgi:hypothetical protein